MGVHCSASISFPVKASALTDLAHDCTRRPLRLDRPQSLLALPPLFVRDPLSYAPDVARVRAQRLSTDMRAVQTGKSQVRLDEWSQPQGSLGSWTRAPARRRSRAAQT